MKVCRLTEDNIFRFSDAQCFHSLCLSTYKSEMSMNHRQDQWEIWRPFTWSDHWVGINTNNLKCVYVSIALHSGIQRHLRLELHIGIVSIELESTYKVDFFSMDINHLCGNWVRSTALIPWNADEDDDDDKREEFTWNTLSITQNILMK